MNERENDNVDNNETTSNKLPGSEKTDAEMCMEHKLDTLHDTKYLLQNYRRVAYAVQLAESDLNIRMEMEHGTPISTFELNAELAGVDLTGTKLESYTKSVIRSKKMLNVIDSALNAIKKEPEHGEMYYQLLYYTYFSPQKQRNREQVLSELERLGYPMSIPTYHRQTNAAVKVLDRILWGYTARDSMEIVAQVFKVKEA